VNDIWSDELHTASFAFQALDVLTTKDSIRRALARHSYPRRDGGTVQDMGSEPRETRCRIIFYERPPIDGEDELSSRSHLERFEAFVSAANAGFPQEFVHPITGSYNAQVEDIDFDADAEERDVIVCDCRFVEDTTDPAAFQIGSVRPSAGGAGSVAVEAEILNAALDAAGLESSVGTDASAAVSGWGSATSREITLELQSLSSQISQATDDLELATNLARHPIWRSMQRLHAEIRRAAQAARQVAPSLIEFTVAAPVPLRVMATNLYGAAAAQEKYAELLRLNDFDDPTLILSGTVVRAASSNSSPRQGLRSATR